MLVLESQQVLGPSVSLRSTRHAVGLARACCRNFAHRIPIAVGTCLALLPILGGCGGADFGDIRVPPDQQHVLKAEAATYGPVSIPADQPFSIHVKKSGQVPGADGDARGESDATAAGSASAVVKASNGGLASAEFNIGHRIDNQSTSPKSVVIEMQYQLKHASKASSPPAPKTMASASLQFVVIDVRKHVVTQMQVVQISSDGATSDTSTSDQRSIKVRFEPQQAYDIMLVGKADATTEAKQEASASIGISDLKMHLKFDPAESRPASK